MNTSMRMRLLIVSATLLAALAGPLAAPRALAQDAAGAPPATAAESARLEQIEKALTDAIEARDDDKILQAWLALNDLATHSPEAARARDGGKSVVCPVILRSLHDRAEKKLTALRAASDHKDGSAVRNTFDKLQDICDQMTATDAELAPDAERLRDRGAQIAERFGGMARPPAPPRVPDLPPPSMPTSPEAPPIPPIKLLTPGEGNEPADKPPPLVTDADLAKLWQEVESAASAFSTQAGKSLATTKVAALAAEAAKQARAVAEKTPTIDAIRTEYVLSSTSRIEALVEALRAALDEADSIPHDEPGKSALGDSFLRLRGATLQFVQLTARLNGQLPPGLYAERAAIETLVHISDAQWVYRAADPAAAAPHGFARSLGALLRSEILDRGDMQTYDYVVEVIGVSDAGFQLQATPASSSAAGCTRSFYLDQSGIVHFASAGQDAGPSTTATAWVVPKPDAQAFLEGRALGVMRTIEMLEALYKESEKTGGKYASDLKTLVEVEETDPRIGRGVVCGYSFTLKSDGAKFSVVARPLKPGRTGTHAFYADESGSVHYTKDGSEPTASSPEVEQ